MAFSSLFYLSVSVSSLSNLIDAPGFREELSRHYGMAVIYPVSMPYQNADARRSHCEGHIIYFVRVTVNCGYVLGRINASTLALTNRNRL